MWYEERWRFHQEQTGDHRVNNENNAVGTKQPYETPTLVVKGTVAELTQVITKVFGSSDGFTFNGLPITNAS